MQGHRDTNVDQNLPLPVVNFWVAAWEANFISQNDSPFFSAYNYRMSSHKRLGVYYFDLLLKPALKGDSAFFRGPALIISFLDSIENSLKFWPIMA